MLLPTLHFMSRIQLIPFFVAGIAWHYSPYNYSKSEVMKAKEYWFPNGQL